jgi:oligopeptidase B
MKLPAAKKIPYSYKIHNQEINDEYHWLRDKEWPSVNDEEILGYLKEENEYFNQFLRPLGAEKQKIFTELKARIKLSDQSPYIKKDNYNYYTRTEEDKDYTIYCRSRIIPADSLEEILLDVNNVAIGKSFTKIGTFAVSSDHKLLAYSVDFTGDERYRIKVYDIDSQTYLDDDIGDIIGDIVWHEELQGFFYTPVNENWRHDKVMFHYLGAVVNEDKLVFCETDPLYQVYVSKASSKQHIIITVEGHSSNESYVIAMSDHGFIPKLIRPREDKIFYSVDHSGEHFYIKTNHQAKDFRLVRIDVNNFDYGNYDEYIKERPGEYLSSFDLTKNYLILNYKINGLPLIKVHYLANASEKIIDFPDQAFNAEAESCNYDEDDIRVYYSSLATPNTTYSYDFSANKLLILKIQEIPSGFEPAEYMVERIFAGNSGVKIPITLFYKKSLFKKDGSNPLYLYAYGSYGISVPVSFKNAAVTLANNGFIYAVAHVRGGDELGHDWYEAAKFLNKKRTFEDFIAVSRYLIDEQYTSKGNIVICGGSAGGLLVGAAINEQPELFKAAIAHVPFVDILNTMLDDTLPLTPGEFKEWGNPKELDYFNYIKSYSPYDNIKAQNYPHLFVTCAIADPRVGYWEAAKWVARIKATKTNNNLVLLKTNLNSGHVGASGRFEYLKEVAEDLVFIFKLFS